MRLKESISLGDCVWYIRQLIFTKLCFSVRVFDNPEVFLTTRRPERVSFKILLDGELIIDGDIIILAEEAIAENGVDQFKSDNKLRHMSQNRHKDGLTENIFVLVDGKDTGGQIIHKPTVSGSDSKVLLKHRVKIRFNMLNLRNFVAGPDFLRPRHVFNPHKLCQKSEIKKILQTC